MASLLNKPSMSIPYFNLLKRGNYKKQYNANFLLQFSHTLLEKSHKEILTLFSREIMSFMLTYVVPDNFYAILIRALLVALNQ